MEEKRNSNTRWKYHLVQYSWKSGSKSFSYRGRLCSRLKNDVYLVDWDDGSTSEVQGASTCSSPPRNGKPFGATVSVLQPLRSAETTAGFSGAHQKALQTSGYSKPSSISPMDGAETSFCICLQLNDVSHDSGSAELKHWYNEADKSHQRAREVVIIQVFHLLLEHKIATQLGENIGVGPKVTHRTFKANNGKPPSAKDSALRWAAANFLQKSRDAANSSLTPAAHTAVWCEHMLLKGSADCSSFMNLKSLLTRIQALGINITRANGNIATTTITAVENPMGIALREFVAGLNGKLENSTFEELDEVPGTPVRWRVVAVGVDEETKQRVAYYYRDDDDRTSDRPVSLGECEWSSLKEVWAWVIRTSARKKAESLPEEITTPLSKKKCVRRHKSAPKSCDGSTGLFALADAVEHTDIGDAWLAGDGRLPDLPPNFLQDYWTQVDLTEAQKETSKFKKVKKSARNVFPVTHEVVLAALEAVEVPENKSRGNVRQDPDQILEAMCLGAVSCRGAGIQASISSRDRPRLTRLLVRFAKERHGTSVKHNTGISAEGGCDSETSEDNFYFSSIQVNKNYASAIHVDRNNYGPSLITGLGSFEGGELWTYDQGPLDVKNQWVGFDGNLPHGTLCFTGTRYSLIYFTISKHDSILPFHRNRLVDFGFPLPPVSKRKIALESDRTVRDLNSGHCAFQCWLKQGCKGKKKQQTLLCGPNCAAQRERQKIDSPQVSHPIGSYESHQAWVESISPGLRVEARYLGGESYYTGTVINICVGAEGVVANSARSACPPKTPAWSADILFDDGDRDCIHDPSFLRPLVSKAPSPVSPVPTSDQTEAIKKAIASAGVAASPASENESIYSRMGAVEGEYGLRCCPLMKSVQFTDAALQSDSECHLSNVDSELRRIVSRFPLKTRLFDTTLLPDTVGQIRIVIGYSLVASNWVVRTRTLETKVATVSSEDPENFKGTIVDYPSQTFAQRTALDALVVAYSTWNTERQLKAKEEAAKAAYQRRFDARHDELLAHFPVGTLLFDFDNNVRELRYVTEAVWTEGSLKEAFAAGGADEVEEAVASDTKTKRASRGWWSLSTKPAWEPHALPWRIEKRKNEKEKIPVDEEVLTVDDDEELYLAETDDQLKDLETMVYAAADISWQRALFPPKKQPAKLANKSKNKQLKRKVKSKGDDSYDWEFCVDQACTRGKERLKELLVEQFPLCRSSNLSAPKNDKRAKTLPDITEACTGTTIFDVVRREERQLVECKWVEATTPNITWGGSRSAGGCLPDGGWALCGELITSVAPLAKKSISHSRSGRVSQTPSSPGTIPTPPRHVLYPAHTIDDRMELDSMVAAAQARVAFLSTEKIATIESDAKSTTSTVKTSTAEKGSANRSLGPLIPSRWARLTARELLDLIPMQSLALLVADSSTYRPFLDHVQTKTTGQASSPSSTSKTALDGGTIEDWKLLSEALAVASASAKWLEERDSDYEVLVLGGGCVVAGQPRLTQLLHLADDTPSRSVLPQSGSDSQQGASKMRGAHPKSSTQMKSASTAPLLTCLDLTRILSSLPYSSSASAAVISAISTCEGAQKRTAVLGPVTSGRGGDAWRHHKACCPRTNPLAKSKISTDKRGNPKSHGDLERQLRILQAAVIAQVLCADEYWKLSALMF